MPSVFHAIKTPANGSMVPAKLQRQSHTKHADACTELLDFFRRKCEELKQSKRNLTSVIRGESLNAHDPSYEASYHTARCDKAHMAAEHILSPELNSLFPACLVLNT